MSTTSKEFDYLDEELGGLEAMGPKQETHVGNEFRKINNCKKATWKSQKL